MASPKLIEALMARMARGALPNIASETRQRAEQVSKSLPAYPDQFARKMFKKAPDKGIGPAMSQADQRGFDVNKYPSPTQDQTLPPELSSVVGNNINDGSLTVPSVQGQPSSIPNQQVTQGIKNTGRTVFSDLLDQYPALKDQPAFMQQAERMQSATSLLDAIKRGMVANPSDVKIAKQVYQQEAAKSKTLIDQLLGNEQPDSFIKQSQNISNQ